MPIEFYDSLSEFSKSLPATGFKAQREQADDWSGYQTYTDARRNMWTGDAHALEQSEKLLAQVESDGLELETSQWEHDRTGFIPCVPSYLAGSPDSMRRLVETTSDVTPIKIFVDICLSAHFSSDELVKRGAAILALSRKLSTVRPVECWVFASLDGKPQNRKDTYGQCAIPVIKIETNPLDLTTASYAFGNAAFLRRLCFAWGDVRGFTGSWAWHKGPHANRAKLVEFLGIGESDMLIDGAYATDQLMKDPVKWVNDQVRRYASVLDTAS